METTVLRREDLIEMLSQLDFQLDQLNDSLEFHISEQKQSWEREQEVRLNSCVRQLESLERKITSNWKQSDLNSKALRLKLSC
ncbi:hypothetical protein [Niallia sp. Krafla_26]|uniref:hypothetical protein n=1 Tax=Niallia sp. Krafla_26 TaxID=3064703 RepID=UPI003D1658DE